MEVRTRKPGGLDILDGPDRHQRWPARELCELALNLTGTMLIDLDSLANFVRLRDCY
ncbi:hypothetical protein GCM10022276_23090 [Sphingomonas limnosediminicola]|uniref:Uncharacterized protein n=1 Tax=Sphingomonas limnosediminicola TaxID=940133 RepID=A0ABP7LKR0_9SPHN